MAERSDPSPIEKLLGIMTRLRDPRSGCPWDIEQTYATIAPYTIEEAYEVADAIDRDDKTALVDELGDLLFQVVFYAEMAREEGAFEFNDVVSAISDKMIRRHPHVFGTEDIPSPAAQRRTWESLKAEERNARAEAEGRPPSALDGVANALPALLRAEKLQRRAARVGFDWPDMAPVMGKLDEELAEIREALAENAPPEKLTDEIGDLIFSAVNLARRLGIDPENAVRHANAKFDRRFRAVEAALTAEGKSTTEATLSEMDDHWNGIKRAEI